jgi:hypothetical protein
MGLRAYQWCEILGIVFILLSTGAQIFWVQPYERDLERRERYLISSVENDLDLTYFKALNQRTAIAEVVILSQLNKEVYAQRREKLSPTLEKNYLDSDLTPQQSEDILKSSRITDGIRNSELWQSIEARTPFERVHKYWIAVQRARLDLATWATFGFFLFGSLLTAIGRGFEMRRANRTAR